MRQGRTFAALLLVAATLAGALPAHAAESKTWMFSILGGYGQFDKNLHYPADSLADAPLGGLRLGYWVNPHFSIEASGSWGGTNELRPDGSNGADVTSMTFAGSLLAHLTPEAKWGDFYAGAGFGYNQYKETNTEALGYGTFEAAAGLVVPIGNAFGLRLEARNILNVPKNSWATASLSDQQYWGGLTYTFGGKAKDADGDGVADKKDKCPDTPKGATVNAEGCPTDADDDGVFDGLDQCAGTAKGARVDAKGCPTDSDGDGVFDGVDACESTPQGASVDAKGCPTDADGDGVFDGIDRCPNTAAGLKVDVAGCPIEVTEKETELLDTGMIRLQNVNFETGRSTLVPESFSALDEVGTILLKWPQLNIEIGGHTDSRGSEAINQRLSESRAQAVKTYLVDKFPGLAANQLAVKGYGEVRPLVRNSTQLNMAKNRRVEFKVTNRDVLKKEIERRKMLQK